MKKEEVRMKNGLSVLLLLVCACSSSFGQTQQPQPIVLKGGRVLTITHGVIPNGTVVMEGGKITAVGAAASIV